MILFPRFEELAVRRFGDISSLSSFTERLGKMTRVQNSSVKFRFAKPLIVPVGFLDLLLLFVFHGRISV